MGASSEQHLRDRLTGAEAASAKVDGDGGGGVFYVKGGHVLEWERAPEDDTEDTEEGEAKDAGESPPSRPCCCSDADSSVGSDDVVVDVVDEGEAVEIAYEEIYPTKPSVTDAQNDDGDGDLSSSASTEPLALSYDLSDDSSRDCSDDGNIHRRSGDGSFDDDEISEGSFSLPCVRILDFSEVAEDEIGGGGGAAAAFERQLHEGVEVEIEFSPDYFSDASTEGEDDGDSREGDDGEEEESSLNYSDDGGDTVLSGSVLVGSALELDDGDDDGEDDGEGNRAGNEDGQTTEAQDFSQMVRASLREVAPPAPAVSVCASFRDDPEQRVEVLDSPSPPLIRRKKYRHEEDVDDNIFSLPPGSIDECDKWWASSFGDELLVAVMSLDEEEELRQEEGRHPVEGDCGRLFEL